MKEVNIAVPPRPYSAFVESGLLRRAGEQLVAVLGGKRRAFVVSSRPVRRHWGPAFAKALGKAGLKFDFIDMGDGERYKTMRTVEDLSARLVKGGADRSSVVIAFGGGVVGDVAGFVASIYMRGIDVVQVPTTLVAQLDSAIGGKTGVNLPAGKNLLGTFHQPRAVLVDPHLLSTLPEREYRSGLYEALKCGVIRNPAIFEFMEQERGAILRRDGAALEWLITECIRVKSDVVAADEREGGLRRILNFGHTVGHALEAETAYKQFLHGEAVAWGMIAASTIAAAMQKTDSATARRVISAVLAYAALPRVSTRPRSVLRRLQADKKTRDGVVHFVLPTGIGKVEIVSDVPDRAVLQAVEGLRDLSRA
ncbi:MAG: 3-dehydroquinate synthase [Acidobacteriia bacterium]|nr:3-dehydroquinate synthase [Terriglobia bacterium]